jgi:hypothetical protein
MKERREKCVLVEIFLCGSAHVNNKNSNNFVQSNDYVKDDDEDNIDNNTLYIYFEVSGTFCS